MSKRVLRTILNEGDLDDVDLVVGPLFTDNVVFFSSVLGEVSDYITIF